MGKLISDGLEIYKKIEYNKKKKQINESYSKFININDVRINGEIWKL